MKKQGNNLVTKEHFDKKMSSIDRRFKSIDKRFEDMDKNIDTVKNGLIFYIDEKFKPIEEFIKRQEKIWEKISETIDWLVHKYSKFDEELTIIGHRYPMINDKLDNHETRIQVLEKKSSYVKS